MPCFSRNADSVLSESVSVSNAESHLASPLATSADLAVSVISSPNGSAVCTGAAIAGGAPGVSADAGGGGSAGGLTAGAAGGGVAGTGVAGVSDTAGAG